VRRQLAALIIGLLLWLPALAVEEWRDADAGMRIAVTVDEPTGNLADFPVEFKCVAGWGVTYADISNGYVSFYDGSGTRMNFEPEVAIADSGGNATFIYWVCKPFLYAAPSDDQNVIYLYYDKTAADASNVPTSVWDANFKVVYHLQGANAAACTDSKGNHNVSASGGSPAFQQAGAVGYCVDFEAGTSDYLYVTDPTALETTVGGLTLSAWTKLESTSVYPGLLCKATSALPAGSAMLYAGSTKGRAYVSEDDATALAKDCNTAINDGAWHQLAMVWDGSTLQLYTDGSADGSVDGYDSTFTSSSAANLTIGRLFSNSATNYWDGLVDECRWSAAARSAAWIAFEYANANEADNELTPGSPESAPAGGAGTPLHYYRRRWSQ